MHRKFLAAALLLAALVLCCVGFETAFVPSADAQSALPQLALVSPVGGLTTPVGIVNAADASGRLFVVEQGGRIRIIKNGALVPTPFLDISTRISTNAQERGLLGLAFPPGFSTTKRFYVYYTDPAGDIRIARYRVSAGNPDVADPASEQVVITVPHPTNSNHNGGQLAFGRDGLLYAGTGDGGGAGDQPNNAQNTNVLLGKILRLDVETNNPTTYTVPSTNPFVGRTGFRPEIWAYGVRNPWRFSFDRQTGDLYIADVGQGSYEEIDFQPASSAGGENYGWRVMEGFHCFNPNPCDQTGLTLPVVEYGHNVGSDGVRDCSVTGGYVYRAGASPRMQGLYFYADFCSGRIWGLRRVSSVWQSNLLLDTNFQLTAFGEDEAGNLYAASYGTGEIYSVVDTTPPPSASVGDVSVTEGNGGQTAATFTITLSRQPDAPVTVNYHTSDVSAVAPGDYQPANSSVVINADQTSASVSVQVNGDTAVEPDETFTLNLDSVSGPATLGDTQGVGTILNDDTAATPTPTPTSTPTPSPTATPNPTPTPEVKFGSPTFVVPESAGASSIPVVRSGDSTVEMSVDYATSNGTASSRSDYTAARGTLHFAPGETQKTFLVLFTDDDTREGDENLTVTLSNLVGSSGVLEGQPSRVITIQDDDATTSPNNPVDRSDFFVRQHYLDFLNREADAEGLAFWTGGITSCGADAGCREVKRVDTSAAFFLSIEFQETGFLAYRMHKTAFGDIAGKPVPIRFDDFIKDAHEIGDGVVVNRGDWQSLLDSNKRAYADEFVRRAAFVARYPQGMSPADYVNALNANAGGALTSSEAADLAARVGDGRETRASALLKIAEDADLRRAENNRAFVLMEYFGYLRRNPDDFPDTDFAGYNFWLSKLNQSGGDFRAAEMVKAFISAIEYRQRFGP